MTGVRRWLKFGGAFLLLVILIATGLLLMARPALPNPNGHDRLLILAAVIPPNAGDFLKTNSASLTQFAQDHSRLIADVEAATALPSAVPLEYSPRWIAKRSPAVVQLRRLEKAVLANARYHETIGNVLTATSARLASIKLGQQGTRGGILIDFMVGSAIQIFGLTQISNSLPLLDEPACQLALRTVEKLRASQDPLPAIMARERHWILLGSGWWQDWETIKEMPAFFRPGNNSPFGMPRPKKRFDDLQSAYSDTESALRQRLTELTDKN